jgi:hypothetical protein
MQTKLLTRITAETTKQKGEKRKKPEPEEQEGMPQHQQSMFVCLSTKQTQIKQTSFSLYICWWIPLHAIKL